MKHSILAYLDIDTIFNDETNSEYSANEKLDQAEAYKPELTDLLSLHKVIEMTSRTTILEFGCGWSSLIFAASLKKLSEKIGNIEDYRRNNSFESHSVDSIKHYIDIAQDRIPEKFEPHSFIYQSDVEMVYWNNRAATEYMSLPLVNPDLIYIDGPDQFNVIGELSGWSTRHKDMMPMSCDVLKIEHFLTPQTIIIIDGRAANARFIKNNLQRDWKYKYCDNRDQHFFLLDEKPLGKYSRQIIEDIYYRNGKWSISDL